MLDRELLFTCGLGNTEQEVLIHLLQSGASTGGLIAKRLRHKRTTIYTALSSLEKRGLVVRERGKHGAAFLTIDPNMIASILKADAQAEFNEVKRASDILDQQLKSYGELRNRRKLGSYDILSTESKEAVHSLLLEILTQTEVAAIWDIDEVAKDPAMVTLLKKFSEQTAVSKNTVRDIVVEGKNLKWYLETLDNKNHQIKVIPKDYSIPTDFILTDEKVFLTSYEQDQEMIIQIRHDAYYQSMVTLFNLLWDYLPESTQVL